MLDHSEVSLIMCDMQNAFISTIEEEGQSFPTLIIMNRESSIHVDDLLNNYNCILSIEYSPQIYDTYITRITLHNQSTKDDAAILQLIKEITFRHSPDSIGYIAQCLYKPMNKEEFKYSTTDSLNLDPDTIRILHNCFFVKGDKKGYLMITPYLKIENKEKKTLPLFVFDDDDSSESINCTVTTFEKPWEIATQNLQTRIPNPYL